MKSIFLLFLCVPSVAASVGGESRITEVKVFNSRASVVREQRVRVPKGAHSIEFRGVTPLADRESLKGSLSEKKSVRILGIRVRQRNLRQSSNTTVTRLEKEQKLLLKKRDRLQKRIENLVRENKNLSQLFTYYRESFSYNLQKNRMKPKDLSNFLKVSRKEYSRAHGQWKKAFLEFTDLQDSIDRNEAKLSQAQSPSDSRKLDLMLDVVADKPTRLTATIQYLVPNANWRPAYDLRLGNNKGRLEQYALIKQSSGESWNGVQLTLSHSRSTIRPTPPSLSPYQVSFRKANKVKTIISGAQKENRAITVGAAASSKEPSDPSQEFNVPGAQTIRDGMAETKIYVAGKKGTYEEELALLAGQMPRAFRRGTLDNPFSWNLGAGPVNIFYGSQFVQATQMAPTPPGGEIALNAGLEDRIQVTRSEQKQTEDKGLLSKSRVHRNNISMNLKNLATQPLVVRVWEQIPISELEAVKISIHSNQKRGRELASKEHEGWKSWRLALAPGEESEFKLTLEAELPPNMAFSW